MSPSDIDDDNDGEDERNKSERKRCRERERRLALSNAFDQLAALLAQIDPDSSDASTTGKRKRNKNGGETGDGEGGDNSGMTRQHLITRTMDVLKRLHKENTDFRRGSGNRRGADGDKQVLVMVPTLTPAENDAAQPMRRAPYSQFYHQQQAQYLMPPGPHSEYGPPMPLPQASQQEQSIPPQGSFNPNGHQSYVYHGNQGWGGSHPMQGPPPPHQPHAHQYPNQYSSQQSSHPPPPHYSYSNNHSSHQFHAESHALTPNPDLGGSYRMPSSPLQRDVSRIDR